MQVTESISGSIVPPAMFCFVLKKVRPSRYTLAQLSVLLLAVGDVPGIKQYIIWFEEQTRTTHFLILLVFLISTQLLLNNYSVDSQLNFLSYILDWTSESLFLISFLKWGGNILAPGIVTPCSSCLIRELFQDFSSFYKFWYLVLSTCLLRFLVSFVENACHLKIFKCFLDFYVLKMPCDWGT